MSQVHEAGTCWSDSFSHVPCPFFARTFSCRGQTLIPARCRMRFSWIEFVRREARTKQPWFSMSLSVHYPCKLPQLNINKHPLCVPACVPAREHGDRKFWCNKIADQNVNALYLHLIYSSDRQAIRSLGGVVTKMEWLCWWPEPYFPSHQLRAFKHLWRLKRRDLDMSVTLQDTGVDHKEIQAWWADV